MPSYRKTLKKVLSGTSDTNIRFNHLRQLMIALGCDERIKGSHHIFTKDEVEEILNLQPKASKAKPYQDKQVRRVIDDYDLGDE